GRRARRAGGHYRPRRPQAVERARTRRTERRSEEQRLRTQARRRSTSEVAGGVAEPAGRWRPVERAEGGRLRTPGVGRRGLPTDGLEVAGGPGFHPSGAPTQSPHDRRPDDPEALEKNLRERLRRLRRANPGKSVELWAQDEARLGLKPIARRVWSPKGRRPRSCGRTRYEWLYLYGFVRPKTGQTFGVLLPRVKAQRMFASRASTLTWRTIRLLG